MFESITEKFSKVFVKLSKRVVVSEKDFAMSCKKIQEALLEGDVALETVKHLLQRIKDKVIGLKILDTLSPGEMIIKVVKEELTEMLGGNDQETKFNFTTKKYPYVMLLVGLQGSGKTTTAGKLALFIQNEYKKKVLLSSLDIHRPAAQEQLEIVGAQCDVDVFPILPNASVEEITKKSIAGSKKYDVLILDTAGRLHIDENLLKELTSIKKISQPNGILLVVDSLTGQDGLNIARTFHDRLSLDGIIITKIDGDARGGVALSMRHITNCPIKFIGSGEDMEDLEIFHPDRIAGRILGMGDVTSLIEKASKSIESSEVENMANKVKSGNFNFNDLVDQLKTINRLGGLSNLMKFIPGMNNFNKITDVANNTTIRRFLGIINAMTPQERTSPDLLKNASRKNRIAEGSGVKVNDVNLLVGRLKNAQQLACNPSFSELFNKQNPMMDFMQQSNKRKK